MLNIESKAPSFKLPDKGKWVVLYFYPKDDTPGCTTEACDFSVSIKDFQRLDAEVIGISPDAPDSHARFIEKHSLKVILLSDVDHKVLEEYGVWQLKKNYGKEYMGVVRSTYIIDPEGKIASVWEMVSVKEHVKEVSEKLKSLMGNNKFF